MTKIALAMEIIGAIERVFDRIKPNAINPIKGTLACFFSLPQGADNALRCELKIRSHFQRPLEPIPVRPQAMAA
jgi:hypothetical protein